MLGHSYLSSAVDHLDAFALFAKKHDVRTAVLTAREGTGEGSGSHKITTHEQCSVLDLLIMIKSSIDERTIAR